MIKGEPSFKTNEKVMKMEALIRGQKIKVADYAGAVDFRVEVIIQSPLEIDITCFGLNESKQLSDDRYMIFYNQTQSPASEIVLLESESGKGVFTVNVTQLPRSVQYIVFTATIDGEGTMKDIQSGTMTLYAGEEPVANYIFSGTDFQQEKAILIAELYNKNGWRLAAIGAGFDGGLAALLKSFGGEVAEEQPEKVTTVDAPTETKRVQLEKKMAQVAPQLLDLSKKAKVTLEKVGLSEHTAKVALCLDISGSMGSLYSSGKIQAFAERILALSTRFDDDGSIDIFLFGQHAHNAGELSITNFTGFIEGLMRQYPLEGGTYYAKVMALIRAHYFGTVRTTHEIFPQNTPVYVMFVTDGDTFDRPETIKHVQQSSYEPLFWQFMAIGASKKDATGGFFKKLFTSDFSFLESLDDLPGRFIDNADFFSVPDPTSITDEQLYDLLMMEYPTWVQLAKQKGLLR